MSYTRLSLLVVAVMSAQCGESPVCVAGGDASTDGSIADASQVDGANDSASDAVDVDVDVDASDGGDPPPNLSCPGPTASSTVAVNWQIDAAHDGAQPTDSLSLPLCMRWSRNLHGHPTSVSLTGERVFVTTSHDDGTSTLSALDPKTGYDVWGPISFPKLAQATVVGSVTVVLRADGAVTAYDTASGAGAWSTQLSGQPGYSELATIGSHLFAVGAGGGSTIYALDGTSGALLWSKSPYFGGIPTLSTSTVYGAGDTLNAFDLQTGTAVWPPQTASTSAHLAPYLGARIYVPSGTIWDATSRTPVGFNGSDRPPALLGQTLIESSHGRVMAISPNELSPIWSFGDGHVATAPIVVGPAVVVASDTGAVSVLRGTDGLLLSNASAGDPITTDFIVERTLRLTEASGLLLVATDSRLVAF